jgi:hypothetical protein
MNSVDAFVPLEETTRFSVSEMSRQCFRYASIRTNTKGPQ